MEEGTAGSEMYIVVKGEVVVFQKGKQLGYLNEGSVPPHQRDDQPCLMLPVCHIYLWLCCTLSAHREGTYSQCRKYRLSSNIMALITSVCPQLVLRGDRAHRRALDRDPDPDGPGHDGVRAGVPPQAGR